MRVGGLGSRVQGFESFLCRVSTCELLRLRVFPACFMRPELARLCSDKARSTASSIQHTACTYIPLGNHFLYVCSYKTQEDVKSHIFIQVLRGV